MKFCLTWEEPPSSEWQILVMKYLPNIGHISYNWEGLRNGVSPAISINKDITAVSDSGPPDVTCWACSVLRKTNTVDLAPIRLPLLPTVSKEQGCEEIKSGCWLWLAEMHMKGIVSVSPSLASSNTQKWVKFLNLRYLVFLN